MQVALGNIEVEIMAFGIARDILGGTTIKIKVKKGVTVNELQKVILKNYPRFTNLASLKIAINQSYASGEEIISEKDEIVLIPPVCGG